MATKNIIEELEKNRQKIDVDHYDITIREISSMSTRNELHIAPTYQRKFRWSEQDESRLIESLFLGLPVPSVYVATNKDSTWEVVDGLQRLSTIIHFMAETEESLALVKREKPLKLSGLETLQSLNGQRFSDLPTSVQLQFKSRMLRLTALSDKSDPEVRFDVFERLNRGGVALTAQEVRACVHAGKFIDLLDELSENSEFKKLVKLKVGNLEDGTKQELVLKYFAYSYSRGNFDGKVSEFLNTYIKTENQKKPKIVSMRNEFLKVCSALSMTIGGPVTRPGVGWTPQNQFEAILVATGELIREGHKAFEPKPGWLSDKTLVAFSTGGTNTKTMLEGRINRAKELLLGATITKIKK